MDFSIVKAIHFVGLKGVAMTALAIYAKEAGFTVTGSDIDEEFPTSDCLKKAGIGCMSGFLTEHIKEAHPDLVIYTGAHDGRDNVEVIEALRQHISVLPHGKALGEFMKGKRQISVAGSHGKTTTTAMIATILTKAGLDPSYTVGCGEICGLGMPGHYGKGEWFIAEADEYVTDPHHDATPRFLWQRPEILVVTNIDFDHPDVYASLEKVKKAFEHLRDHLPSNGQLVISSDDRNSSCLIWQNSSVITVGQKDADAEVSQIHFNEGRTFFSLSYPGEFIGEFMLRIPGSHNASNAAMAVIASLHAGATRKQAYDGLQDFCGTRRRFEKVGEKNGIIYFDDYAHHPEEIKATLAGARNWYPNRRIISIFQPHTFSRTSALLDAFAQSFIDSSIVIFTDIYASAREKDTSGVSSKTLLERAKSFHPSVFYASGYTQVAKLLKQLEKRGDIIVCMGAGDIYTWSKKLIKE